MRADGTLLLIQPHQRKRPFIAVSASRGRRPVIALVNPVFQPLINGAMAAIGNVIERGLFERIGTSHHRFRVRLASLSELREYLHLGQRPPRFPAGGRQRLLDLWRNRPAGARIEVTEWFTVIGLRVLGPDARR